MKKASASAIRFASDSARNAVIDLVNHPADSALFSAAENALAALASAICRPALPLSFILAASVTMKRKGNQTDGYCFYSNVKSASFIRSLFAENALFICEAEKHFPKAPAPRKPAEKKEKTPYERACDYAYTIAKKAAEKAAPLDKPFTFMPKADYVKEHAALIESIASLYEAA